jgi:hypothetical protein
VSFSDRPLSVICLSVCLLDIFISTSSEPLAKFNLSWQKSSLGEGDSNFKNECQPLLQGEIIAKEKKLIENL